MDPPIEVPPDLHGLLVIRRTLPQLLDLLGITGLGHPLPPKRHVAPVRSRILPG